jgi:DNA-binding CsgD family transcriptional regulator
MRLLGGKILRRAPSTLWWVVGMNSGSGELVRSDEWRRVYQFAVDIGDHPAALVIAGEAGAGKSVLWQAAAAAAARAGHRVLRTEPSATEAELPFVGLSDLLTDVLPAVAAAIPEPQREALEVALLVRPAGDTPPTAHAVGLAVLAALRAMAAEGPLLVAVDDVQWLDEASQDALTFAFRRAGSGPAKLLAATRTDPLMTAEALPAHGWRDLAAAVPAETIELAPLDDRQIRRLLPSTISAARVRDIARQSGGNPFWAREIAASLESDGSPVPTLARTLTDRLARSLSEDAGSVLAMVAACGRVSVRNTMVVLDHLDDPGAALDEAVLAGVVTETAGRLAAAHPLIGAAAVEALPPMRRQQLYTRLAEVGDNPETKAHFAALAAGPQPDSAVAAALDAAAEAAYAKAGNAEAARFAVQAVQFTPDEDDTARIRRRIRAAELLFLAGDPHRSLEQAAAVGLGQLATPDLERLLPLLLDMTDLVHGADAAAAIVTRLADGTDLDPRRRALVLMVASDLHYGIKGGRREAATEAIRSAEAAGPAADTSLHQALLNLVGVKARAGDGLDYALLDRAERLETGMNLNQLQNSADLLRGLWSRCVEDLDTARAALSRSIARAREAEDDFHQAAFLAYLADTEELAGDYAAAREALAAADAVSAWHDWPAALSWYTEPRCELLMADGDLDTALTLASERLPDTPSQPVIGQFLGGLVRGRVAAWRGDMAGAVHWFERAAASASESGFTDPGVRHGLDTALAEAYLAQGRTADARPIAAWLREVGDRLGRPALTGCACRIDAQAAAHDGDLDTAVVSARQAVAAHEASPLRPELARSLLILGQLERRRKARRQSRDALTRAHELARAIGHRPLQALIERELPRTAAARAGDELTATEQQVAELVATGATNRDAAAALFISVRTVETHVASVYRKLGVRNRAELARAFPRPAAAS